MARQGQNVENEAFQHYLQTQRNFIDDHDMGLRDKTLDDKFMASITKLLERDATRAEAVTEIRRILAATGVQSKSADDIPESSCSEMVTHAARLLTMVKVGPLESEPKNPRRYVTWNNGTLKRCLDEYFTPRALPQWWYDRRNSVQWYTFWIAIVVLVLTVFFGLVQSIEGAIQVYKAYHPS